jgi:hypothetical protein
VASASRRSAILFEATTQAIASTHRKACAFASRHVDGSGQHSPGFDAAPVRCVTGWSGLPLTPYRSCLPLLSASSFSMQTGPTLKQVEVTAAGWRSPLAVMDIGAAQGVSRQGQPRASAPAARDRPRCRGVDL